jgi:hypothetical protein
MFCINFTFTIFQLNTEHRAHGATQILYQQLTNSYIVTNFKTASSFRIPQIHTDFLMNYHFDTLMYS